MSLPRLLLRLALGGRPPVTDGELRVPGLAGPLTVRRDRHGVPHVDAAGDADAAFGTGFCQGQDRGGQLEALLRLARGTLSEWVGKAGLGADRMSRRLGFRRSADAQLTVLSAAARDAMTAFAAGVNAGRTDGLTKPPHEFAVLGGSPTPWDPADVLAVLKLQSFLLPSNWDVELARLRLLATDGPDALLALDPVYPAGHPVTRPPGDPAAVGPLLNRLAADLALFRQFAPRGGGSNNWAIAGSRTATGKPLLASDPHLGSVAPPPWYLIHLRTPEWEAAGAGMAGTPGVAIGHNGTAAWGVTAGLTDNTDLFLETLGPDGTSVREADGSFTSCPIAREVIRVKGGGEVVEDVLLTPRGPVVTPLIHGETRAVSLRAVWLDPLPIDGFLTANQATTFDAFRRPFAAWPMLPMNLLYADTAGNIGWQLAGQIPQRKTGHGTLPLPADTPNVGWEPDHVPFDQMPFAVNPDRGFLATANNLPTSPAADGPFLGLDYCDGYRAAVILDEIARRPVWDAAACGDLQRDCRSLPWEELRPTLLALTPADAAARDALDLLREWDGHADAESPAAGVFELFLAEMCRRVARAKAPVGWAVALGESGFGPLGHNLFADRRVGHLVRLVREQPDGWFPRPWADELADALGTVVRYLRRTAGPGPAYWAWGHLRQLTLSHPVFGRHRLLKRAFNLGPFPVGGDPNTVSQAGTRPADPTAPAHNLANLRTVFDLADLPASRFVLCGGQSGNPASPHFDDQLPLWQAGRSITIPFAQPQVVREARSTLRLLPVG